ncbi:MAG: hypothetical protein Q7T82_15385 [Armatimonadota bacterium]|nr:hypothetical protein [Armatimonadota bacterium]
MAKQILGGAAAAIAICTMMATATLVRAQGPGEQPIAKRMIAGKEWTVSKGKEPGTFDVHWGDESMTWRPKPWYEDKYKEMGPAYYAQWDDPKLPFPFDVPLEERHKLSAEDIINRSVGVQYLGAPYFKNGWDRGTVLVYTPAGAVRQRMNILELATNFVGGKNLEYLPSAEQGEVQQKYVWALIEPTELRYQGGVTTVPMDKTRRPTDTLYLPTVRKVRRLAGSVSQQYFPGSLFRYEDSPHVRPLPELEYRIVGFSLFNPDPKLRGYGDKDMPDIKRVDSAGDVIVKIEIKPKAGVSWWYAKREWNCSMQMLQYTYSNEFDATGAQIRYAVHSGKTGSVCHIGTPDGPPAPDWYQSWGSLSAQEFVSGYSLDGWEDVCGFDADVKKNIFSEETQMRQPQTLTEWLQ